MTSFTETLGLLPPLPPATTQTGSGFFPPIWRTYGHLQHLLAMLNEEGVTVTDEEAAEALTEARAHLDATTIPDTLSTTASQIASTLADLVIDLQTEWPTWDEQTRTTNLNTTLHRFAAFIAFLDRELTGLTGSEPGFSL